MRLGRICRWGGSIVLLSFLLISSGNLPAASKLDGSCLDPLPLVKESWPKLVLGAGSVFLGEWRLPISSALPEVMTHAYVRLYLQQKPGGSTWRLRAEFEFDDPQQFGIPFTFQRLEFSWLGMDGPKQAFIDWSEDCSGSGRSIFPGQKMSAVTELAETGQFFIFENASFNLWGSRN